MPHWQIRLLCRYPLASMMMNSQYLITVEGIEGTGKTTLINHVVGYFLKKEQHIIATREPGGTLVAEKIRSLLLDHSTEPLTPTCELLLAFAARSQHLQQVIKPALKRGSWVVSDRFVDASYAYQCYGRGLPYEWAAHLEQMVCAGIRPGLTFLLDLPLAVSQTRVHHRGHLDRIENSQDDFFIRVQKGYYQLAASDPDRIKVIDANQPLEAIKTVVDQHLDRYWDNVYD